MENNSQQNSFENWDELSEKNREIRAYRARLKPLFDRESMIGEAEMRGREMGRKERIEEDRKKVISKVLLGMLTVKFEVIPVALKERIKQADSEVLNELILNIFNFEAIEDVWTYLR